MNDDELIAAIRARASNPATRTGTKASSLPVDPLVATAEAIAASEGDLGFALPPFLRRIYAEVIDGGFGPGYGMLSLAAPGQGLEAQSLSSVYGAFRAAAWPERLLPLWDWGCATWSCLDGASPDGFIVTHDDVVGPTETEFTIHSWMKAWVEGVDLWNEIYEDKEATITNPFTKKPVVTRVYGVAKGIRRGDK